MVETSRAKQVCRSVSSIVYPELDFGIKPCGSYTREEFFDLLSQIAFTQEFANTGGKTYQLDQREPVDITSTARNQLAKSFLYHLRNLSADAIDTQFDGVRDRLLTILRERRLLPDCVDLAVDLHEWRYYAHYLSRSWNNPCILFCNSVYCRASTTVHIGCASDGSERLPRKARSRSHSHRNRA